MKSHGKFIYPESAYFVYAPSKSALEMFFYPLECGHFIYEAGYRLRRESYDSFLLMYIVEGCLSLELTGKNLSADAGCYVLLDCYQPHAYSADARCECLWCHFDGGSARRWCTDVISRLGNVFSMPDAYAAGRLNAVYDTFASGKPVREPLLSKYLSDILTAFLLYTPSFLDGHDYAGMAEDTVAYVNEHFAENLTVEMLARRTGLSQYHFIRVFKKETGFTPHDYIINTRMANARYLLKNSQLSIKEVCFNTGFSCESVFCSSFKKRFDMTPAQYRTSETGTGSSL